MSSRARLINQGLNVDRFDWGGEDGLLPAVDASAAPGARLMGGRDAQTHDLSADQLPGDENVRLAALERDAFAKGYAQGERAGVEAGAERVEAMLRRVAHTLEELSQLRKTIVRETEREMVRLALELARRVVLRDVSLDPTLVAAMAHVALDRLGDSTPATIKLHPDDYAVICRERGDRWEGAQVTILADASVARGGCLVESDFGTVNAGLDAQFDEMTRALLGESMTTAQMPADAA